MVVYCLHMKEDIKSLLSKPLWQLSGEEYVRLHAYACTLCHTSETAPVTKVTGVRALAESLSCCESTVYKLRREGVLDNAIISHIGKNIVFDAQKACSLAKEYRDTIRGKKNGK